MSGAMSREEVRDEHGDEDKLDFFDEVEVGGEPDYYNAHMGFSFRLAGLQAWAPGSVVRR